LKKEKKKKGLVHKTCKWRLKKRPPERAKTSNGKKMQFRLSRRESAGEGSAVPGPPKRIVDVKTLQIPRDNPVGGKIEVRKNPLGGPHHSRESKTRLF